MRPWERFEIRPHHPPPVVLTREETQRRSRWSGRFRGARPREIQRRLRIDLNFVPPLKGIPWTLARRVPQPGAVCTLTEARVVIEDYRCQDNFHRPHSKLGYQSPKPFAATTQSAPSPAPVALRAPYAAAGLTKANNITNNKVSD